MSLTRPNQELRRDLKAAARDLEEVARQMFAEVGQKNVSDLMPTLARIEKLHAQADRLKEYAEEVREKTITRK